jgi:hypothetical protein
MADLLMRICILENLETVFLIVFHLNIFPQTIFKKDHQL